MSALREWAKSVEGGRKTIVESERSIDNNTINMAVYTKWKKNYMKIPKKKSKWRGKEKNARTEHTLKMERTKTENDENEIK